MSGRFPPRIFRRVPFEAELRLRFEDGEEITARSANVSLGGMFVVAAEPRPVGSTFELSFKLPEQPAPVRGRGRVVWLRTDPEEPGEPAGMGVRFLELTPGSRELIFEVVERRVRDGGSPYDEGEDTGSIADRRAAGGAEPAPSLAISAAVIGSPEPLSWPPSSGAGSPVAPAPVPPPARPSAGSDLEASGARPAAPVPPDDDPEGAPEESFPEPAPEPETIGMWDRPPAASAAPLEDEEEPEPSPPVRPALPPVEMPDPPRMRWMEETGRGGYPSAGGGYAARARRRGGRGWWLVSGVALLALAGGAWWLLRGGEEPSIAAADQPPAAARPDARAGEPEGTAGPTGAAGETAAGPDAAGAGAAGGADTRATAAPDDSAASPEASDAAGTPGAAAGSPGTRPDDRLAGDRPPGAARAPEPSAAPAPVVTPGLSPGRASRVTHITWRQEDGATELVIWGDGRFDPGAVRTSSLGGERPRTLLRLIGIGEPFESGSVEVGTPQVERVRTGLHLETEPDELHVVVDLASGRVTASEVQEDGERLRLRLEGD